jgi:hypothetical protein
MTTTMNDEFTDHDQAKFMDSLRRIRRLPSVETQTVEWFRFDSAYGWRSRFGWKDTNCDLWRSGFRLYVRGMLRRHEDRQLWVFTVARVEIPERFRSRGWFGHYLEMCWRTMPHDGLVLEHVQNKRLYDHFSGQPEYIRFAQSFLRLSPRGIGECPTWPAQSDTKNNI